ncbi:vWA domain-containing protein [Deinococcus rubellus]|uniref:vWA domain-containing protein n=1 Tax=Deinococcus rubellus TaxID=1889240 RepID=UPI0031E78E10
MLRRSHDFRLGVGEVSDALQALERLGLADPTRFRLGLRSVLCARQEDIGPFDEAFDAFFFPVTGGLPQPQQPPTQPPRPRQSDEPAAQNKDESEVEAPPQDPGEQQHEEEFDAPAAQRSPAEDDPDAPLSEQGLRAQFSAQAGAGEAPSVSGTELEAMLSAASEFINHLRLGHSRRWRPEARGARFDLRRTLRASLSTGGEALGPRWLAHPNHNPRLVLLLDGSRSMEVYTAPILQFAYALSQRSRRVDVFTFSTELRDITAALHPSTTLAARGFALPDLGQAWGGGTRIGECLHSFLREHGQRCLGPETLVIVSSDGLDVGEPEVLGGAMRTLARRSRGIIWLNPLSALPGYAPTARGISAALPYLNRLTHAQTPQEFARLGLR